MRHIPNILSVFRILLIPFFVWQMLQGNTVNAAVVLIFSGLTDILDGGLARRFNWISSLGKVLDPVADKATQVAVCLMLARRMPQFWYFFALILLKELVMLLLGGWLLKKGVRLLGARWFGKVVTTFFYIIMVGLLFFPAIPPKTVILVLGAFTVAAFVAGCMYIPQYNVYRKQAKNTAPKNIKKL